MTHAPYPHPSPVSAPRRRTWPTAALLVVLAGALLVAAPALRATETAGGPQAETAREVIALSGLEAQIDNFADSVIAGAANDLANLPPEMARGVEAFLRDAFAAERLQNRTEAAMLAQEPTPARLQASLDMLREPLVRRITQMEVAASDPDRLSDLIAFMQSMQSERPPKRRVQLARRISQAMDSEEYLVELGVLTGVATLHAMRVHIPPDQPFPDPDSSEMRQTLEQSIRQTLDARSVATRLFIYQEASEADLAAYVERLESPEGQWLTDFLHQAHLAAVSDGIEAALANLRAAPGSQ